LKDEQKVHEHAKSCGALEQVYGECSDAIQKACIFYAETEKAIRHGIDEHKGYNLIRQRLSEITFSRHDMKHCGCSRNLTMKSRIPLKKIKKMKKARTILIRGDD
jgi:hypothetical protein